MRDTYNKRASGVITIYKIVNNIKQEILTRSNTILANADVLCAEILAGNTAAYITNIRVYNGVTLKANGSITSKTVVEPNKVEFQAVFSDVSFNGNFDNCKLGCADAIVMGNFAEGSFAAVNKLNTEELVISWSITFNNPL